MMNTRMMNDEMLTKVAGGNYGDTCKEFDSGIQFYNVGDTVEVFNTLFHASTKRGVIEAVGEEYLHVRDFTGGYVPKYFVRYSRNSAEWVFANDIERN